MWLEEAHIFGGAKNEQSEEGKLIGKSRVRISLDSTKPLDFGLLSETEMSKHHRFPIKYLAFGTQKFQEQAEVQCLLPTFQEEEAGQIKLELSFAPELTAEQVDAVKKAVAVFLFFGNMGSKSRNGFGKLYCADEYAYQSYTYEDWLQVGKEKPLSTFTAFSKETRCFESNSSL